MRKETPNKQSKPITCLDRDHDLEGMKTIEVRQESLQVATKEHESNIVKFNVELHMSNKGGQITEVVCKDTWHVDFVQKGASITTTNDGHKVRTCHEMDDFLMDTMNTSLSQGSFMGHLILMNLLLGRRNQKKKKLKTISK
jgi:hypothetical protein